MLWTYGCDWQTPVIERFEWKTDVITAYNGSEQRIAVRQYPRRSIEFAFLVGDDRQRRALEAKLWANGAKAWDVPIFPDTVYSTQASLAGSNTIHINTAYCDFAVGNKVVLKSACTDRYLLAEIANVYSNAIVLTAALTDDWDVETAVVPVRPGYLNPNQQITRFTGDTAYDVIRFEFDDVTTIVPEVSELYRNFPVVGVGSDWQQDLTLQYQRKVQVVDFGGTIYRDDETGQPALVHSHYWVLDSREKIHQFKQFLFARRGRLTVCWLPSFLNDFQIVSPISTGSYQINVEYSGYLQLYQFKKNRRDIRIELQDGTVLYRRIVNCVEASSEVEQLTLDQSIPQNIAVDDVVRISFMSLSRLDADNVELAYHFPDYVNVNAIWRSTNDDL